MFVAASSHGAPVLAAGARSLLPAGRGTAVLEHAMGALRPSSAHTVLTEPPRPRAPANGRAAPEPVRVAPALRRRLDPWLLGAIAATAIGLTLRLVGLAYGLPDHFHWDEPTIMNRVIRMGGGDLNPHFFYYPTLLMYVMLAVQGVLYAAGHALHVYPSTNAFAVSYLTDSTASYLSGRALVAITGGLSVFLTYLVGRRYLSAPAGLIGASLLAVSPVHIGSSHFVTNDVPMAFFALLACLFLWNVYTRGRGVDYLTAGVAIGLGVSIKYLPVVLLVSLALAHAFRLKNETSTWRDSTRDLGSLAAGIAAAGVAFAVTSPFVVLDWRSALHDYGVQSQLSSAAGCTDCGLNFGPYLTQTMGWAVGWIAYLLAIVGVASLAWTRGERRLRRVLLASFPVMLFLMVGAQRQPWARWLVPVAPFACMAAGAVLWAGVQRVFSVRRLPLRWPGRMAAPAAVGVTAVLTVAAMVQPAIESARFDRSLLMADPRTQAASWFESRVPDGTVVAIQPMLGRYFFTAQLHTDAQLADLQNYLPPSKAYVRDMVAARYKEQSVYRQVEFTYSLEALRAEGVRYVVISSAHYHNVDPASEDRLYAELASRAHVAARFMPAIDLPDADNYPVQMPTITVYELPPGT
jgi:4-amino-4-deoxy-L-arabinose transferase-like glycosyltransferase